MQQIWSPTLTDGGISMLRKLLGVVAALALPAVLVGQTPPTPNAAAVMAKPHGIATQVQGEVVGGIDALDGLNNQEGVDEADGENNDGEFEDGDFGQDGVNEPDGLNNDVNVGDQVDQAGDDENVDDMPAPPSGTGQIGQIGRHKP
jgi:hypothetical protein